MSELLQFIRFKDTINWSVSHLLESQFQYNENFELEKIGNFLNRNKTQILIEDEVEYKRVKIKLYNKGVFLRNKEIGKNIGTKKQFIIKEGQFLLSKIDARNGAFGLATDEVDKAIITADFFAYDIDITKIEPYFLVLMTTTKKFQQFAQSASSGTTGRQRIDEKKFLDVKIPLPPLDIQKQIVKNYQDKLDLSILQEQQAKDKEKEIEAYLYDMLGVEIAEKEEKSNTLLQFINFKDMCTQWGCAINNQFSIISNKYEVYILNDFCTISSGGTPSRSNKEYYKDGTIPWIKTGEVRDSIIYQTEEKITRDALNNSSAKIYPKNSLIVAMYGATAGRTAKLGIEASTNQACSVLYNIDVTQINIDFLWFYLISQLENFKILASGSAQPNLNADKVKNYKIPLPPLKIQNQIANHIQSLKDEIKLLKEQSLINKSSALVEFEMEIFSED